MSNLIPRRVIFYVLVSFVPVLFFFSVLAVHNVQLTQLSPLGGINDGIYYWIQAKSFRAAGFESGYFTLNEWSASNAFSRYYTWGPFVPALFGTIGRFVGWELHSIPIINISLLSIALLIYLLLTRPSHINLLLAVSSLITFSALLPFLPTSTMMILNLAIALVLAGVFVFLLRTPILTGWQVLLVIISIIFSALLLSTWMLLLVPLTLLLLRRRSLFQQLAGIAASGFIVLVVVYWLLQLGAFFPNAASQIIAALRVSIIASVEIAYQNLQNNLYIWNLDTPLELQARNLIVFVFMINIVLLLG